MRAVFPASFRLAPRERGPVHVVRRPPRSAAGPARRLGTGARVVHRAARRKARLAFAPLSDAAGRLAGLDDRQHVLYWGGTSVLLHLLALVPALRPPSPAPPMTVEQLRFIAPLLPKPEPVLADDGADGAGGPLRFHGMGTGSGTGAEGTGVGTAPSGVGGTPGRAAGPRRVAAPAIPVAPNDAPAPPVYTAIDVDREIERSADAGGPAYPEALRREGTEGTVIVEFVVDETGHVDPTSVQIVESSHPLFAEAVRTSLDGVRFVPARRAGVSVRQRARQLFSFRLEKPGTAPADSVAAAPRPDGTSGEPSGETAHAPVDAPTAGHAAAADVPPV